MLFFVIKDVISYKKEGEVLNQDEVRNKLLKKTQAMKQKNISEATGIPKEIISKFMNGKRDLWESSLLALNDYLDNY